MKPENDFCLYCHSTPDYQGILPLSIAYYRRLTPSLPKDGAASKIVAILKDVAKYGILNEATVKRLQSQMCIRDSAQPLPLTSAHDLGPDGPRLGRRPGDIRLPDADGMGWAALQVSLTRTGDIS